MTKEQLGEKLKELGIVSKNYYPKNTFLKEGVVYVGMFRNELEDDFYFYSAYNKTIYHLPKQENVNEFEIEPYKEMKKYLVPLERARIVWEDKPFEELPDELFSKITVRQYAFIHLKTPESGLPWLDDMIRKSLPGQRHDTGPM